MVDLEMKVISRRPFSFSTKVQIPTLPLVSDAFAYDIKLMARPQENLDSVAGN